MSEITIPYHLAIPSALSFVCLLVILIYRKRLFPKRKLLWSCITLFLVSYLIIVGGATYESIDCQWNLNNYDLNKDGLFSGEELTNNQKVVMENLTSDTGRKFSFITGLIFAFVVSTVTYIVARIIINKRKR